MFIEAGLIWCLRFPKPALNADSLWHWRCREIATEVAAQLAIAIQQSKLREQLQNYTTELEQRVAERTRELQETNTEMGRGGERENFSTLASGEGINLHPLTPSPPHPLSSQKWVRLWIQDNGIGIASEYHERIFRVFERLHGIETYPGMGLGLAIVRKCMERMGGQAGVESQPDQGSRFWIELPKVSD